MNRASSLADAHRVLLPQPLVRADELEAYYRDINPVRGSQVVERMELGLKRSGVSEYFKAFLMGHAGVGKSTEISQLLLRVEDRFRALRFSVQDELDSVNFRPFDVLWLIAARIAEELDRVAAPDGTRLKLSDERLNELKSWFEREEVTRTRVREIAASVEGGAGPASNSMWATLLGLFAEIKGEMKYASQRESRAVEYHLGRLSELVELVNRLIDEANDRLYAATNRYWLVVGEDFDKPGIPQNRVEDLFLTYANVFRDLRCHFVFTLPIALGHSTSSVRLPLAPNQIHLIPDTPVFDAGHQPHYGGRAALSSVLDARMDLELFAGGQLNRLIVASGGNLRDLFALVARAADNAQLRTGGEDSSKSQIGVDDASDAIGWMRDEYRRRLGQSPYDAETIDYPTKARRMEQIHAHEPGADVTDACLYSLLRSRLVQEFNHGRWLGIHPLVVDVLVEHGYLDSEAQGGNE